jgi:hypothetical protein
MVKRGGLSYNEPGLENQIPPFKGEPMIHLLRRFAFPCAIFLLAALGAGWAQTSATLSDDQVRERLSFIERALDAGRPRARLWLYGWLGAYSAGTAVQWGLAAGHWNDTKPGDGPDSPPVRDREFAQDMLVGGATTALGVVGMLIDPFVPASAPGRLKSLPETTSEERRAKLEAAEDLLRRCARREREGRGWGTHLLNLGVNAAAGAVTAAAFRRPWTDGLITFAAGEAVSLLNIFTQPTRAVRDWQAYQDLGRGDPPDPAPAGSSPAVSVALFPRGLSLSLAW